MKKQSVAVKASVFVCILLVVLGSLSVSGIQLGQEHRAPVASSFFFMPQISGIITDPSFDFELVNIFQRFRANVTNITVTRLIGGDVTFTSDETPHVIQARWLILNSAENLSDGRYDISGMGFFVTVQG